MDSVTNSPRCGDSVLPFVDLQIALTNDTWSKDFWQRRHRFPDCEQQYTMQAACCQGSSLTLSPCRCCASRAPTTSPPTGNVVAALCVVPQLHHNCRCCSRCLHAQEHRIKPAWPCCRACIVAFTATTTAPQIAGAAAARASKPLLGSIRFLYQAAWHSMPGRLSTRSPHPVTSFRMAISCFSCSGSSSSRSSCGILPRSRHQPNRWPNVRSVLSPMARNRWQL